MCIHVSNNQINISFPTGVVTSPLNKEGSVVSEETVVLRRWVSETRKSIRTDEGLTLETSAFQSLYGGQFTFINSVDKPNFRVAL